jgi:hypothetical protein
VLGEARFLVAVNFSSRPATLVLGEDVAAVADLELSTDPDRPAGELDLRNLTLDADEGVIARIR